MPPPPVQSANSAQTTSMKRSSVTSTASTAASSSEKPSSQPMRDNGSSSSTSVLSSQMKPSGEQPLQTPSIPIKKAGAVFSSSTAQAKMRQQREQREARLKEMRKNLKVGGFRSFTIIYCFKYFIHIGSQFLAKDTSSRKCNQVQANFSNQDSQKLYNW